MWVLPALGWADACEHGLCEPGGQARRNGEWGAGRPEYEPGQDLTVDQADDQRRCGVDVGRFVDAPEPLLGPQAQPRGCGAGAGCGSGAGCGWGEEGWRAGADPRRRNRRGSRW